MSSKFSILMFTLSLVSLANAVTVSIESFGMNNIYAFPSGGPVSVDVVCDTPITVNFSATLMESTTCHHDGHSTAVAVGSLNAGFDLLNIPGGQCNSNTVAPERFIHIQRINGVIEQGSPAIPAGQPLYSYQVQIPYWATLGDTWTISFATGTPTVGGMPPPYGLLIDTLVPDSVPLVITYIPEPATLWLLGLGAAMLRRKNWT